MDPVVVESRALRGGVIRGTEPEVQETKFGGRSQKFRRRSSGTQPEVQETKLGGRSFG